MRIFFACLYRGYYLHVQLLGERRFWDQQFGIRLEKYCASSRCIFGNTLLRISLLHGAITQSPTLVRLRFHSPGVEHFS